MGILISDYFGQNDIMKSKLLEIIYRHYFEYAFDNSEIDNLVYIEDICRKLLEEDMNKRLTWIEWNHVWNLVHEELNKVYM